MSAAMMPYLFAVLAAVCAGIVVYIWMHKRHSELRQAHAALTVTLEMERQRAQEKISAIEKTHEQLSHTFAALSSQALRSNNEEFLRLATENLKQFQIKAQGELEQKEKSFENLVTPIKQALEKTEQQIQRMELERKEAFGSLSKHLEVMMQSQQLLQGETRNLVQALRRPEVRGQWGEMTLKRLAELAGMVEHCDFYTQETVSGEDSKMRPDMVVRMPDGREIVVDVKTPLDAYLSAVEAADDVSRTKHLEHHARKVRERVRELATKAYWNQFKNAPDFVVLFIPGDQFLSAALDVDHSLLEEALQQKIILATPTSFVALLRAVAYGWRQEALAANADLIREVGEDLYQRLAVFTEHLSKLGGSLEGSVSAFNKAVGSFDSKVLPGARKFVEMGVTPKKALEPPTPLEITPRGVPPQK